MAVPRVWHMVLVAGLTVFVPEAQPLCQVPQPRLVCAEYANSEAVVIAKLTGIRDVVQDGDIEGHFYDFATRTLLRGQAGPAFQVWEENNSGRAGFTWTAGVSYLLFLSNGIFPSITMHGSSTAVATPGP